MSQDMHNLIRNNEITARARRDYGSPLTRLRLVTTVNIGTLDEVEFETKTEEVDVNGEKQTQKAKVEVKGVDIRGNVYGGGNKAEVTGQTNVVIGKEDASTSTGD